MHHSTIENPRHAVSVHGSIADPEHHGLLDDLVIEHTGRTEYESASEWPPWTDDDVWELTETDPDDSDRSFWAQASEVDRQLDRLADEARGLELITRGLAPNDPSPAPICGTEPHTIALEGDRWSVRRGGQRVFLSRSESSAREELALRDSVRMRVAVGFTDADMAAVGAVG